MTLFSKVEKQFQEIDSENYSGKKNPMTILKQIPCNQESRA